MRNYFNIDTPPPYTSGILHIGHAYQYIPIDILKRYCKKFNIPFSDNFGFDVHGLPTELKARTQGINDITGIKTIVIKNIKSMLESFKKLDIDISDYWTTDDKFYITKVHDFLKITYQKDLLEVKDKVNYYCIHCKTNLSKSEIGLKRMQRKAYEIKFEVEDMLYSFITTKPELLKFAVGIFVNPNDERYVKIIGKFGIIRGVKNKIPIIADDFVKINYGTGIVFVATYGNLIDVEYINRHNLTKTNYIDKDGLCDGLDFEEFKYIEIKKFQKLNLILNQSEIISNIFYHSERASCQKEVHYISTPQIYIKSKEIKQQILNVIQKIEFSPKKYKNELISWCNNLENWCISRQNKFGTKFNFFVNYKTYQISFDKKVGFTEISDVCDCWLDSSITWTLNNSNVRFQGYQIIRTWLLYSIIASVILQKQIFTRVRFTSLVLGENGKKISKSNFANFTIDSLLEKYNSDIIRLWATKSFVDADTIFSDMKIIEVIHQVNKIKSIFNFYDLNIHKQTKLNENESLVEELKIECHKIKDTFHKNIVNLNFSYYDQLYNKFIKNYISKRIIPEITKCNYNINLMNEYKNILEILYDIYEIVIPNTIKNISFR